MFPAFLVEDPVDFEFCVHFPIDQPVLPPGFGESVSAEKKPKDKKEMKAKKDKKSRRSHDREDTAEGSSKKRRKRSKEAATPEGDGSGSASPTAEPPSGSASASVGALPGPPRGLPVAAPPPVAGGVPPGAAGRPGDYEIDGDRAPTDRGEGRSRSSVLRQAEAEASEFLADLGPLIAESGPRPQPSSQFVPGPGGGPGRGGVGGGGAGRGVGGRTGIGGSGWDRRQPAKDVGEGPVGFDSSGISPGARKVLRKLEESEVCCIALQVPLPIAYLTLL